MSVGERLKQWRRSLGLTQAAFAERVGLHLSVLKKYDAGANIPGGEALAAIAATGCNINWLLTGAGEMDAQNPSNTSTCEHSQEAKTRALLAQVEAVWPLSARLALLDDLIARAQTAAEISTLRRAVAELQKHLPTHPTDDNPEAESDD